MDREERIIQIPNDYEALLELLATGLTLLASWS